MTAKCRCIDAHTLDCYWFTPDREAYDELAAKVVRLTRELESARRIAVALEQEAAKRVDDRERLARQMLNTVDPLLPGHEARMACVQIVRADRFGSITRWPA